VRETTCLTSPYWLNASNATLLGGQIHGLSPRGGTSYEKLVGQKILGAVPEKNLQLPSHYSSLPPLIGDICLFAPPPVEAMHAVTIMSLKATVVQLSVGTVC